MTGDESDPDVSDRKVRPMRRTRALTLSAAALVLTTLSACGTGSGGSTPDDVIKLATLPLSDDLSVATPVEEISKLLEEETGMTVEVTDVPNYSAVIEAIPAGHEDIGLMSGFPSALEDITPETVVAFADPASSSGFFTPTHMLSEAGKASGEGFTELFSGSHANSFVALQEGQADVACTSTLFTAMEGTGDPQFPFEEGETRSIGESIAMPVSVSMLGNQQMSEEKRQTLLEAIPAVFSDANRETLGIYMEGIPEGTEPIVEPGAEVFQPFVDIAAIADVDISDLQ